MSDITFKLEPRPDTLGQVIPTLIKVSDGKEDEWCNVNDLDRLFDECVRRWGRNWDLEKVCTAIREATFD